MSITRSIFFGAAASWFSRGVAIVLGLVILPILFRTLPKGELGIWLLLGQSWGTLGILDLGLGVTLTRRIAFAKGKSGSDPNTPLSGDTKAEIADLLATGVRVYRVLALLAFVISFGLGALYLQSLELHDVSLPTVWTAWGILCLSFALTTWAAPWTCLLQGVGYVGWDAILASFIGALTLLGQIAAALLGGGLLALAAVAVGGALAQRIVILGFARRKRPELFKLRGNWKPHIIREMLPLALHAWLTAVGASVILYTDQFIIASFKGASELPAYRAAWVLIHNFSVVAVTFGVASGVFVSHLWQSGDLTQIHRMLERNVRLGWLIMLTASAVVLFVGEPLFSLWLGPGNFVGYPVLMAFLFTEMLETQSYIISTASRATGDEAFAGTSLAAGGIKLILSIVLAQHLGLLGVALGTVIALMVTNHWYVPWRGLGRLKYPRRHFVRSTVLPCMVFFAAISALLAALKAVTQGSPAWLQFSASAALAGIALIIALFLLVIEPAQRLRLFNNARLFLFKP